MSIITGDEEWLFLVGGANDPLSFSTGQRSIDDNVVRGWQRLLELREAWLSRFGIAMYTFVAPNKEVVYSDRLPAGTLEISERRPVRLIEERLRERSNVHFDYPLRSLVEARAYSETYPADDTHWNGRGAYTFYRHAMETLVKEFPDARVLDEMDFDFEHSSRPCDLGIKLRPPKEASQTISARVRAPRARVTHDNGIINNGHLFRTAWSRPPMVGPKILFLHDSFHYWVQPMFAESFPTTVAAHNYRLDFDLIEQERPDIVFVEITERFLIRVPDDVLGMTTDELRLAKQDGRLPAKDGRPYWDNI